ncbi:MAG: aminotransferase class I/II-fold pyridoxal phosphate-dependent enzyme [Actinobacteria bacterium]|nr:aminotransferase class I/II-fold pyridoxal phosphate-dependent enzyme [Actinomycetota bacterium]
MRTARRIEKLPPYLFAEIDRKVAEAKGRGADIISFGVGDPDLPTPQHVVEALIEAARDAGTHRYPSYTGMPEFRKAIADWYGRRFEVRLDPDTQVQPLVGSKEGIFHLPVAFVDPGDVALVPDPGYPVYETGTILAGGEAHLLPLREQNDFLPDLGSIPRDVLERSKVLWVNYPSNPTSATADLDFFVEAVAFCRRYNLLLAHDAAYTEITYDGYVAPSALEVDGAEKCVVEFHSLSKTYNMTGWRIGWVAGAPAAVEAIKRLKTNIDSGIFDAVQRAGIAALEGPEGPLRDTVGIYQRRRDLLCDALKSMGIVVEPPKGSIYVWVPVPVGHTSESFTTFLLDEVDIVVAPGNGYGPTGEGFVRFSLTLPDDRLEEGVERLRKVVT